MRALIIAALVAAGGTARAEVCDPLAAPAAVSLRDTGFDRGGGVCARTGVDATLRAGALIDTPEFYGTLGGSLFVDLHLARGPWQFGAGARVVDYRFAQNAVVTATELAVGPVQLHASRDHHLALGRRALVVTPGLALDLPFTDSGYGSLTSSATAQAAAALDLGPHWTAHARVAVLGWLVRPMHTVDGRIAGSVSADAAWHRGIVGLSAGAEAQLGWYGPGLDHLLARAGVRLALGRQRLGLALALPVAGAERTDLVVALSYQRGL